MLAYVKGDIESIDEQTDSVSVEVKDSNHPDIWSVEGIARALRGILEIARPQIPRISGKSTLTVLVDPRLRNIRPYIACAIVRGVKPSEEALKSWMSLQDKMDQTYGRKRKRASIGFYRADTITSPLKYTVSKPEAASFVPLGGTNSMSLSEILENHPKGREYGPLISQFKEWPLLVDARNNILSLPPVINSNDLGRIDTQTRNILLEVTGTSLETVHNTLKIVVAAVSERGGRIYSCTQNYDYPPRRTITPNLRPEDAQVSLTYARKTLGVPLTIREITRYLKKAGYDITKGVGDKLVVKVPCYRIDIMHQIDIIEDIAIAMNLSTLKPEWPRVWTPGELDPESERIDRAAELMVGLGYQELVTYTLTSPAKLIEKMRIRPSPVVELENPKVSTLTVVRNWVLPSLLEFLGQNTHVEYPQRVFEIGLCATRAASEVYTVHKLAAVTVHSTAGYTEIRGCVDALLQELGVGFQIEGLDHPSFLDGRCAAIRVNGASVGVLGEVHPEVVRAWGLGLPIAAFELDASTFGSAETDG